VRDRVERAVDLLPGQEVTAAAAVPGGLRLDLAGRDGSRHSLETEHVIAATGFKAHRDRLGLLSAELRGTLAALPDGSPVLGRSFESSHPGLFLAGLVTASGFGPAMRFVHGATFTASTLVQGVRRRLRSTPARGAVPLPGGGSRSGAPSPVSG
jgi:hypothetical protein